MNIYICSKHNGVGKTPEYNFLEQSTVIQYLVNAMLHETIRHF